MQRLNQDSQKERSPPFSRFQSQDWMWVWTITICDLPFARSKLGFQQLDKMQGMVQSRKMWRHCHSCWDMIQKLGPPRLYHQAANKVTAAELLVLLSRSHWDSACATPRQMFIMQCATSNNRTGDTSFVRTAMFLDSDACNALAAWTISKVLVKIPHIHSDVITLTQAGSSSRQNTLP
jgi:hypothetical protein